MSNSACRKLVILHTPSPVSLIGEDWKVVTQAINGTQSNMRIDMPDEITSTSTGQQSQRELVINARIRCIKGKYQGWEGVVKKLTSKTVTFAPDYRHDKQELQRTVPKTSLVAIDREQDRSLSLETLMQTLSLHDDRITRSEWRQWSDTVERAFDKEDK